MEKKKYQTPNTELLHINFMSHLLNWSAPKEDGGGTNMPEAKRIFVDDEIDFFVDEETEPHWSFNVWED